ncbi:MAG: YifB family Mg chelatase-like AAA ATPase [Myxococcota bacterium]
MAVAVLAGAIEGIDAVPIEVEVDLLRRLPSVSVVGLAAGAVKESTERVRSAIASAGLDFPRKRVVVNLAPADVRKDGTGFDLPVALGILAADAQVPAHGLDDWLVVGELSLGGRLRSVPGLLAMALLARSMGKGLLCPREGAAQATVVPNLRVGCADSLDQVVAYLNDGIPLPEPPAAHSCDPGAHLDLSEVRGQTLARRALEISAAGGHHLLMMGPPGCGKSMLARRLPSLLPAPTFQESLEITKVHSVVDRLAVGQGLITHRPFRSPHHSVSVAGLVGDRRLRPGEVTLAHHGVLFLDEAPEFARNALEVLREPLEEGKVNLCRAQGSVEHPAQITLIMACNPCPCGRRGSPLPCICPDSSVIKYRNKLSGPLLDRIDLHVELSPLSSTELLDTPPGESSETVRERVLEARARQKARGQPMPNGRLPASHTHDPAASTASARRLLRHAMDRHHFTGRSATRILRVARTLADLADDAIITESHVAGALAFRPTLDVV